MVRPAVRREVAGHLQVTYGISERRACSATGFGRSSQRYRKRSDPEVALRLRLKELAAARVRYAYRRLHILLRRDGCACGSISRCRSGQVLEVRSTALGRMTCSCRDEVAVVLSAFGTCDVT